MTNIRHIFLTIIALLACVLPSCTDTMEEPGYDYTSIGEPVVIDVPLMFPKMDVRSRADLPDAYRNEVQSLLIATYSSVTGKMTSEGWIPVTPPTAITEHTKYTFQLNTLSGPSYIVAVANVDNKGVLKSNPEEDPAKQKTLRLLLAEADTWTKFLDIATPSPSTSEYINAPRVPLAMTGAYVGKTDMTDYGPAEWQSRNFDPYTIPQPTGTNKNVTMPGCIHLRRLVSQITFNLKTTSNDINITPHSYRVVNAPSFSWLYEREGNYGDDATFNDKGSYYKSPAEFTEFENKSENNYSFNFWIGENKHTGTINDDSKLSPYEQRDKYTVGEGGEKLFTSLTGDTWKVNNMATYVIVNCTVTYKNPFKVDEEGNEAPDADVLPSHRTGTANLIIHLGYFDEKAEDFNSYRNVRYTYNVTINGLNDIRLEALNGGDETPGIEGIVSDVQEPTVYLDCHYQQFNVQLNKDELKKWVEHQGGASEGFGFIITTYDNLYGGRKTFNESSPEFAGKKFDELSDDMKRWIGWVEFRKTNDKDTYALYEPRGGKSGETFNLLDASQGIDETTQRSSSDWYTIFVKEYTYEYGQNGADESQFVKDNPQWFGYVNADPREFFIRVTKSVSADGQSIYAHAKYAVSQKSILTYYNTENITEPYETSHKKGAAVGIERENESLGLKLRKSYSKSNDPNNGRANCYKFTGYIYNNGWQSQNAREWKTFVNSAVQQRIPCNEANTAGTLMNMPQLAKYPATATANTLDPNQGYNSAQNFIEAINACMNRNRDNNGDGIIDEDEMRWYVPAMGKYLRMVLGSQSLGNNAIINFDKINKLTVPSGLSFNNQYCSEYLFYSSDDRILWSMEGMSTSTYDKLLEWSGNRSNPWQVRCIRNLGIDLNNIADGSDPTVPAYTKETVNGKTRIIPTYYNIANMRNTPFTGNGTGAQQMPVHSLINYTYNSVYRFGFEIYDSDASELNNLSSGRWTTLRNTINNTSNNPCSGLSGSGWRLPNVSELAIMRNIGIFENDWYLSCTMSAFNESGTKVTPNDNTGTVHYFLWALKDNITQSWNDHTSAKIRCVRDITE